MSTFLFVVNVNQTCLGTRKITKSLVRPSFVSVVCIVQSLFICCAAYGKSPLMRPLAAVCARLFVTTSYAVRVSLHVCGYRVCSCSCCVCADACSVRRLASTKSSHSMLRCCVCVLCLREPIVRVCVFQKTSRRQTLCVKTKRRLCYRQQTNGRRQMQRMFSIVWAEPVTPMFARLPHRFVSYASPFTLSTANVLGNERTHDVSLMYHTTSAVYVQREHLPNVENVQRKWLYSLLGSVGTCVVAFRKFRLDDDDDGGGCWKRWKWDGRAFVARRDEMNCVCAP